MSYPAAGFRAAIHSGGDKRCCRDMLLRERDVPRRTIALGHLERGRKAAGGRGGTAASQLEGMGPRSYFLEQPRGVMLARIVPPMVRPLCRPVGYTCGPVGPKLLGIACTPQPDLTGPTW